ncbi:tRNA pseudouridine synthase [Clavulina sp. PMI_390]|nr:tRNA pseudouridine synthase [Clavulina sp. PMI_390]
MAAYAHLSREQLIERLSRLEREHGISPFPPERSNQKPFDFSSYPRRKIAIKFCYWGSDYSGLAIQDGFTPLPTVESVLFGALAKARLVDPDAGLEGCGWSRCGRTDRGVSAAGQVVSLWIIPAETGAVDPQELRYVHSINQNLPPTIRVLAWSPIADDFDARFSCAYRHYKYIFSAQSSPPLNIHAMRDAAARLEGNHDFRNFCKQDPTKQIENFYRTILRATITPFQNHYSASSEDSGENGLYVFDLVGTAFLYHQVRHIMGILFLVGSGYEQPSLVDALFQTGSTPPVLPSTSSRRALTDDGPAASLPSETTAPPASSLPSPSTLPAPSPPDPLLPLVSTKPNYRMADALPLILWDCAYHEGDISWRGDENARPEQQGSRLTRDLETFWARDAIRASISSLFAQAANGLSLTPTAQAEAEAKGPVRYHLGGGAIQNETKYVPVLERERQGSIEEANARWKAGAKGQRNIEKMAKRAAARAAANTTS